MPSLTVEGWRTSCHSYALVNQYQLLHLVRDPRFALSHRDLALPRQAWESVSCGLSLTEQQQLLAIPAACDAASNLVYRIAYPFRVHAERNGVFVFATSEIDGALRSRLVGHDGTATSGRADAVSIVTPSSWSRRAFLAEGFPADRVHVVPHGVEPGIALPAHADARRRVRAHLGIDAEAFVFLNMGAMTWNKGTGPLLAAFALHLRTQPKSVLILKGGDALYGDGPIRQSVEESMQLLAGRHGASWNSSVRYIAQNLNRLQIAELYHASDAYVSPYRAEGFNIPVLEAMACGIPVIVTSGGPTDDFCPAELGLRIDSSERTMELGRYLEPDIDCLVAQMARIIDDGDLRNRLKSESQAWCLSRYTWARVTAELATVLLTGA